MSEDAMLWRRLDTPGHDACRLDVARTPDGVWTLNGTVLPGFDDCVDLDLGFTPATNLLPIRRLGLGIGEAADAPAAWLDLSRRELERLPQRYEQRNGLRLDARGTRNASLVAHCGKCAIHAGAASGQLQGIRHLDS